MCAEIKRNRIKKRNPVLKFYSWKNWDPRLREGETEEKPHSSFHYTILWIYVYANTYNMYRFHVYKDRYPNSFSHKFLGEIIVFCKQSPIAKDFVDGRIFILGHKVNETPIMWLWNFFLCKFETFNHPFNMHVFNNIHILVT